MGKAFVQLVNDITAILDRNGRNRAPEIMENLQQLAHLLSGNLTAKNIKDGSLTKDLFAEGELPPDVRMAHGQYTGDGAANRDITVEDGLGPFTPTEVSVLAIQDVNEFYARDDGESAVSWYRLSTGTASGNPAEWQGIIPGGFRTGTKAESLSNKTGVQYSWTALRRG